MFIINEWFERYEVNSSNAPAKPGDTLRVSSLVYIRTAVHGRAIGAGFSRLVAQAGSFETAYLYFGFFIKLLEIAGCEPGGKRGVLYNEKGKPATAEDLAFILHIDFNLMTNALFCLLHESVAWIIEKPDSLLGNEETPGIPGIQGIPQSKPKPIQIKSKQSNNLIEKNEGLVLDTDRKAKWFMKKIYDIFRPNQREATTFARITKHLVNLCITGKQDPGIFTDAVEWAMTAKASSAKNKKALFVKKIKDKTGFKSQKKLL